MAPQDTAFPDDKVAPISSPTSDGAPPFKWSHLWEPPIVNQLNGKSYTLPIFNLSNPYSRSFHLSWLGFFAAFLSWFAFPPLIPEAIKGDLNLTLAEITNSNVVALVATLLVRVVSGPLVDRFGPRKVMAGLLVLGSIPSGLASVAHNARTLYVLRFFIGILGGTFIPCQAWTSCFFDKNIVGTANAFVAGWGNMGGGATFAIMVSTYSSLRAHGVSEHSAWRAAFAIIPVPILLFVATVTLLYGQDHPAGAWSQRHTLQSTAIALANGHQGRLSRDQRSHKELKDTTTGGDVDSAVDFAVNETLTIQSGLKILTSPLTWLPALAYLTTFGLELVLDAQMANVLFNLFNKRTPGLNQKKAGYYTSIFGLLNLVTRPLGGFLGDAVYRKYGTRGKKFVMLFCGVGMGVGFLGGGLYLQNHTTPEFATVMGVFASAAIFSEIGNGANFGLVPHCNPHNNGVMTGIVGAFGNLGGIVFALVFRFQTARARAFWIIGVISIAVNVLLIAIPVRQS
ncbi:nitrate/nitrite porter [Mycena filopes]|nr:nitrate/nitrite porter [Mycena filopes]